MKLAGHSVIASIVLGFGLAASTAGAQQGADAMTERTDRLTQSVDEFYLYEDNSKQVVDYKRHRIVRVCVGDSPHSVPLKVRADGRRLTVGAGDCVRVEARKVWLEPNKRLPDLAMLKVDVQTLGR